LFATRKRTRDVKDRTTTDL